MALFWLISRPNSLASFAAALGIDPALFETVIIVFDFCESEFSESRTMFLVVADTFVLKLLDPCDSCFEKR